MSKRNWCWLASLLLASGFAEAQTANILSVPKSGDPNKSQISIPAGANATVDSEKSAAAGPTLGFQYWKQDAFLIGAFFTYAAPGTITGNAGSFGSFLLNPPAQGTSFTFAANRYFKKWDAVLIGAAGRAGVTRTTWGVGEGTAAKAVDGFVGYLTPAFLLSSRTFGPKEGNNEYQFSLEAGPTFRAMGGDLAQDVAFLKQVIGAEKTGAVGFETTVAVKMNQFQPYVRFTQFPKLDSVHVPAFTGFQVSFGINVLSSIYTADVK